LILPVSDPAKQAVQVVKHYKGQSTIKCLYERRSTFNLSKVWNHWYINKKNTLWLPFKSFSLFFIYNQRKIQAKVKVARQLWSYFHTYTLLKHISNHRIYHSHWWNWL